VNDTDHNGPNDWANDDQRRALQEPAKKEKRHLQLLTHSEMQCYQRCPREHFFRYTLRRRSRSEEAPLIFGRLIDECLQVWWTAGPLHGKAAMLTKLGEMAMEVNAYQKPRYSAYDIAKAKALLIGYDARWANEPYEVLRVQPIFRTPVINPETSRKSNVFELGGKLDVIVRDVRTGEIVIVETKTTSDDISSTSSYWHTISALDPQISTYYTGARALGLEAQRVVYDVIHKPKFIPYKATPEEKREYRKTDGQLYANQRAEDETPDEYFERIALDIIDAPDTYYARGDIVRLEQDERDHAEDVWYTAKIMHENEIAERYPRHRGSCKRYGRMCSYFAVCSGVATIESMPVSEEKHEELKEI
jgi:hypothetical protein